MVSPTASRTSRTHIIPQSHTHSQIQTVTQTITPVDRSNILTIEPTTLRLRAEPQQQGEVETRRIQWAEDVVDNEGMGKKSSKACCIYHKAREPGDSSSDDSSSSSDEDSDSGQDDGAAKPAGSRRKSGEHRHGHRYGLRNDQGAHGDEGGMRSERNKSRSSERRRSPNAYERMPRNRRSN